jgi:redox-sensitive bicupin YhaK (pirin superfamily)
LRLVAAPGGAGGALTIHQDARIYLGPVNPGDAVAHRMAAGRHAWLQVLRGALTVNGVALTAGDGVAVSDERELRVAATRPAEVLLFDLA